MNSFLVLLVLLGSVVGLSDMFRPANGFVPDEKIAITIAEAVLVPIYGKKVLGERPWQVTKNGSKWQIDGSMPKVQSGISLGGVVHIEIAQMDGTISNVTHGK